MFKFPYDFDKILRLDVGGTGSGRRRQSGANTTEGLRSIDVRWLKREGFLFLGSSRRITWSRNGKVTSVIRVKSEQGRVILDYRQKDDSGEWQRTCCPVYLETTPCHMGGERQWFLCPSSGCGRRVAVLYDGIIFACRHCFQLTYPSQCEKIGDRASRQADRIREKLGWVPGILNAPSWQKPKGMHWRTFERLRRKHDILQNRALIGMMAYLKLFSDRS